MLGRQVDSAPGQSGIDVRTYPEADFVYIEHAGPYWTLGRAIDKAAAYLRTYGLSAPVIVRYDQEPNRRSTRALHCRVGFVARVPHTPTAPFLMARLPAERTATFTISGRMPDPNADYETLRRWIDDHGHGVAGPITEVYPSTAGRRGAASKTAEIRFALRSKAPAADRPTAAPPPRVAATAVAPVVVGEPPTGTDGPRETATDPTSEPSADAPNDRGAEHGDSDVSEIPAVAVGQRRATPLKNSSPPTSDVASAVAGHEMSGSDIAAGDDAEDPDLADDPAGSVAFADLPPVPAPPVPTSDADVGGHLPNIADEAPQPVAPERSIHELFAAGRYAEAVDAVLPNGPSPAPPTRRWLFEAAARISAICRGITRLDSASSETRRAVTEFLRTFDERVHSLAARFTAEPQRRVESVDPARRALQKTLTRDLDVAMVRISMGSIQAPDAVDSLMGLLATVAELRPIMSNSSPASPAP